MTNEITQNLPKLINESYERANKLADSAKAHAEGAITEAQHCGRLLNKAKEQLQHGDWMGWLTENCPAISQATANRYMRLANSSRVINFDNCASLTSAYKLAEILPETEPSQGGEVRIPQVNYLAALNRLNQSLADKNPEEWDDTTRHTLKEQLRPLHDLYEKL